MSSLQIFSVGGAIRDALLNQSVKDKDWVVVGGTPEDMAKLGYTTVGKDFPVFLHPTSREEYALARTERKTAPEPAASAPKCTVALPVFEALAP